MSPLEIRQRARFRCEYCLYPERYSSFRHQIDHIIPDKHDGPTVPENLALACAWCNRFKGPNLAGIDAESRALTRLFNPRTDEWGEHFHYSGGTLEAHTAIGRVTIQVLRINRPERVAERAALIEEKVFEAA
jgi:hypothetical protein